MTNIARADLALRRVAGVAIVVGLKTHRYSLSGSGALMTGCTSGRWPPSAVVMVTMIKFHVETFAKPHRKRFHWRWICLKVAVTDRTHNLVTIHQRSVRKLIQMAADTGIVTRKVHIERATLTLMARRAFKLFMFGDLV